jgi:hypothetical protein
MTNSFTELYFDRGNFYDFTSLGEFLVYEMSISLAVLFQYIYIYLAVDWAILWTSCDSFFVHDINILFLRI